MINIWQLPLASLGFPPALVAFHDDKWILLVYGRWPIS